MADGEAAQAAGREYVVVLRTGAYFIIRWTGELPLAEALWPNSREGSSSLFSKPSSVMSANGARLHLEGVQAIVPREDWLEGKEGQVKA